MRIKDILYIAIILLLVSSIGSSFFFYKMLQKEKEKARSFKSAYDAEYNEAKKWKDEAGKEHSRIEVIQAENQKIFKAIVEQSSELSYLKNRLDKVMAVQISGTKTTYNVLTTLKDSTISDTMKVKKFEYESPYLVLLGIQNQDKVEIDLVTYDTLKTDISFEREKKIKWLFGGVRIGSKEWYQEVISSNPHTSIIYNKSIIVRRRKE